MKEEDQKQNRIGVTYIYRITQSKNRIQRMRRRKRTQRSKQRKRRRRKMRRR